MKKQPQAEVHPTRVNIELPRDLEAIYSNFALITHSPSEMIIDFASVLHRALGENLQKYEAQFGEVKTPTQGFEKDRPLGFQE